MSPADKDSPESGRHSADDVLDTGTIEVVHQPRRTDAQGKSVSVEFDIEEQRKKIYPRKVTGRFAFYRKTGVYILLGLFYLTVWLTIDGQQAVLWDLPARKFHVFGMVFWPQDFIYLTLLLVVAALILFTMTAVAGRVWCGYACPQTVWTEVFLWIERMVEGSRNQQMKLDSQSMSAVKLRKKLSKHFLWIALSLWTGFTFVGYFTPIRELFIKVVQFSLSPWELFWILFYGFATYGNAGWLREKICLHMCPYARFQSAMFDKDTLIISYDKKRGEPRGGRKKGVNLAELNLGSCIDCHLCVQVCPTGIDIRNGLQYECISCAACIDVCDDVMDKMDYPKGLIRYTTESALNGKPVKLLRPRVLIYLAVLAVIIIAAIFSLSNKAPADFEVMRDRGVMFREVGIGDIENIYRIHIINKTSKENDYEISASGIDNLQLLQDFSQINLPAGEGDIYVVRLKANIKNVSEKNTPVVFHLSSPNNPDVSIDTKASFMAPVK